MHRFVAFAVACLIVLPALAAPVSAASPLDLDPAATDGASFTSTWTDLGSGTCKTGTDGTTTYRCGFEFDLSGIPAGQVITAANLLVTRASGCSTNDCPVDLYSFPGTDTELFTMSAWNNIGPRIAGWTPTSSLHGIDVVAQIRAHYAASQTWAGFSVRRSTDSHSGDIQDWAGAFHLTVTYATAIHVSVGMSAVDPGAIGTITSNPTGIDCGSTCDAYFAIGDHITLTAHPAAGAAVGTWDAPCAGSHALTCSFTLGGGDVVTGLSWALAPAVTPKPTATPKPTPTQRVETAPPDTFVPASPTPPTSEAPASPTEAVTDAPSVPPVATPAPSAGPTEPASDSGGGFLLPLLAIGAVLAVVVVVGGLAMSRRRPGANAS